MTSTTGLRAVLLACAALWPLAGAAQEEAATPEATPEATPAAAPATTDWTVFQEADPVECFSVSAPTSQVNTRDGEPVEVSRSEALLFVFHRPAEGVAGQVAFTGGYPFAPDSVVRLEVEGESFDLLTFEASDEEPNRDEWAWPASAEEDARIVAALRGGSEAVLTGQSARGTVTRDTFSLEGFTASVEDAAARCAG